MTRPCKRRMIFAQPNVVVFKPAGVRSCDLKWEIIALDEYEAIRLIDHLGLDQTAAAEQMNVSRPTVTRIYASARKKIADAIILGQALRIEGGPVEDGNIVEQNFQPGAGRRCRHGHGAGRGRGRGCQKNKGESKE